MIYFLKIRLYLHTETDYLTKETVLIQLFYLTKENGFNSTVLIQLFYENKK